jgi:hypothetical protein
MEGYKKKFVNERKEITFAINEMGNCKVNG